MKRPRLRALVLTAGHGVRLRPLTYFLPKPILPFAGEPVVGHTLRSLKRLGCEAAVLNLHHLADAVTACLGQSYYGLPLIYSHEEVLRGTCGALYRPRDFLRSADAVLLVNGDTFCEWPWKALVRRHLRTGADATLLLHRRAPTEAFGGGVGVGAAGTVVQFRDLAPAAQPVRRYVFAGAHVLSPRLLERIEDDRPADVIAALYQPLLEDGGRIETVVTSRRWHDLGTAQRYLEASLESAGSWRLFGGNQRQRISALAQVSDEASVEGSVVEPWAVIEKGARVESSIVLPRARIGAGSHVRSSIIGPGARLAAANIERRMVHPVRTDHELSARDTVLGELVYTPLEPAPS